MEEHQWSPKPHQRHPCGTRYPTTLVNYVCYRGVAAKAGSVHLIYLMDRKPGQMGGAGHTHNSTILRMPILTEILPDHRMSTNNATNTIQPHNTKMHTMPLHHTPHTTMQPTSCMGGAAPPPHNHQPFTH